MCSVTAWLIPHCTECISSYYCHCHFVVIVIIIAIAIAVTIILNIIQY